MLKSRLIALAVVVSALFMTACDGVTYQLINANTEQGTGAPSTEEYVNNITYTWQDPAPAVEAFRAVTADRGWTAESTESWVPFVTAVMKRESGFCWNLRRGGTIAEPLNCVIDEQGRNSDSGFGQVLGGYPNKRGWYLPIEGGVWRLHENASYLCPEEGLCTPDDIVASPFKSMTALVALVERSGRQPWCYTAKLRRGHVCRLAP